MTKRTEKNNREGMSVVELMQRFPDEAAARKWFEGIKWPEAKHCPYCASNRIADVKNEKPMPYRCRDCRKHFSVKTGTLMADSNVPLHKWAIAMYLMTTSLKGVSSMKLHRDLGMTQKTAWLLAQKIRQAFLDDGGKIDGEVEIDETYIGGKERNKHANKKTRAGRGPVGKQAVLGMKERGGRVKAMPIADTTINTTHRAVFDNVESGSQLYTDDARHWTGGVMGYGHESVNHSAKEYVNGMAHTNGIESFWALLKRGYKGTYHKMSAKHLHRYVNEFSARHNNRTMATIDQMANIASGLIGKRLTYKELISDG